MKYLKYILLTVLMSVSFVAINASDGSLVSTSEQTTDIKIYPNPVIIGAVLTIDAGKEIESIQVMNIVGEVLKTEKYNETTIAKLNTDNLNEGIFFLKISFVDKSNSTKRLWVK